MPTVQELIFALKTFAGAMAALYVAFWLGLENPYWSMATAFIVAQPLTGAMRSKALFRFLGTLIGGVAAVALVPNLVDAPVLLCLVLAGWIGLCLYLSLLDRTPRAYTFMLAGYTAGIIGFPAVAAPGDIFMTALTRVEEISIGIACTTVVGAVLLPMPLGPVLAARIRGWVRPAADWAVAALQGAPEDAAIRIDRGRLAVEAADVAMLTSQLSYDISNLRGATRHMVRLRLYLLSLMPVLSSIGARVAQLRDIGGITPPLQAAMDDLSGWVGQPMAPPEAAAGLRERIAALPAEDAGSWASVLRISLAERLEELVSLVAWSRLLRRHVLDGGPAPADEVTEAAFVSTAHQVRDHGLAAFSGIAAAVATLLVCLIWIETGWASGAGAAVMVAVACSFFAAQDDPAPAIRLMLRNGLIAAVVDAVYIFVVLPRVDSFAALCLVLLPAGLVIGVLVSRPATFGTGMVLGAVGSTILGLENGYVGAFANYVNGAAAFIFGLAAAAVITRLIRSVGAAWSVRRLLRANWAEIARAAGARTPQDRAHMTAVMLDRMGLLMPRLAGIAPGADLAAADVLHDLRVGLNVIGLRHGMTTMPAAARDCAAEILREVATHYETDPLAVPPSSLLDRLDVAIRGLAWPGTPHREALTTLVGLRSLLFPAAEPPILRTAEPPILRMAEPPLLQTAEPPTLQAAEPIVALSPLPQRAAE